MKCSLQKNVFHHSRSYVRKWCAFFIPCLLLLEGLFLPSGINAESVNTSMIDVQNVVATVADQGMNALKLEMPYTKPHLFIFSCTVKLRVKTPGPETRTRELVQKYFIWRSQGVFEMLLPLDALGSNWENSDIQIEQRFSKKRTISTDWFPLAAVVQQVHMKVLVPEEWFFGYPHSIRIIARDSRTGELRTHGTVLGMLEHTTSHRHHTLFQETLNEAGSCSPRFRIDTYEPGDYILTVRVSSDNNFAQIRKKVRLRKHHSLVLDCPTSRLLPGDRVPLRAYVHSEPDGHPVQAYPVTFRINSPSRKMIDSQRVSTDSNGEAVHWFTFPPGMEFGHYIITAGTDLVLDKDVLLTEERETVLDRLVIITEKQRYSRDDSVQYTIMALEGLHGAPRPNVPVKVRITSPFRLARVYFTQWGKTDKKGVFSGRIDLQKVFGNRAIEQVPMNLQLLVTYNGQTDESFKAAHCPFELFPEPFQVDLVPLAPVLVPRVANIFRLSIKNLDHENLTGTVFLDGNFENSPQTVILPSAGSAECTLIPLGTPLSLTLSGEVPGKFSRSFTFDNASQSTGLLLIQPENSPVKSAMQEYLVIRSPEAKGTVFVDVVVDNQLVRTSTLNINKGETRFFLDRSELGLPVGKPVTVSAYQYTGSLTARAPLLYSRIQLPVGGFIAGSTWSWNLDNDIYNAWDEPRLQITRTGDSPLPFSAVWIDYYVLLVPSGKRHPEGLLPGSSYETSDFHVCPLKPELDPGQGFLSTGDDPTGVWRRIHQKQVDRRCEYIWQRLPLSLKGNDSLTTQDILTKKLLKQDELKDPWGRLMQIDIPGSLFYSLGQDGVDKSGDELYSHGGWSLVRTVTADTVTPSKAGLAVTVFDHLSVPAHSVSVTLHDTSGSVFVIPPGKREAVFFASDLSPGKYSLTIHNPSFDSMTIEPVTLVRDMLTYVRVAMPDTTYTGAQKIAESAQEHALSMTNRHIFSGKSTLLSPSRLYLHSEKHDLTRMQEHEVALTLPDYGDHLQFRVLPVTENTFLVPQWGSLGILREFDLDIPKMVKAVIEEDRLTELTITNRTRKKIDISVILESGPWYTSSGPLEKKTMIKPGRSKTLTFSLKPRLAGKHVLEYTITAGDVLFTKKQEWSVKSMAPHRDACRWVLFQPGQQVALPAPPGLDLSSMSHVALSFYFELESFMMDFKDWFDPDIEGNSMDNSIVSSLVRLNLVLAHLSAKKADTGDSEYRDDILQPLVGELRKSYQQLLVFQSARGGYSYSRGEIPDPTLSACVIKTLQELSAYITIDRQSFLSSRYWLLTTQNSDGTWTHSPMDNAIIISALAFINTGIENITRTLEYYAEKRSDHVNPVADFLLAHAARMINSPLYPDETLDREHQDTTELSKPEQFLLKTRYFDVLHTADSYSEFVSFLNTTCSRDKLFVYNEVMRSVIEHFDILITAIPPTYLAAHHNEKLMSRLVVTGQGQYKGETLFSLPPVIHENSQGESELLFTLDGNFPALACYCYQQD